MTKRIAITILIALFAIGVTDEIVMELAYYQGQLSTAVQLLLIGVVLPLLVIGAGLWIAVRR